MTAARAESVDLELQRAELRAVLASNDFVRAPKLANLLAYLCEKLFAGEANQIKEYSIGLEVFHRGDSFDQDSDSIVRVEANRLRKRLAEYYAGEGASHALQITIPLGQYVPRFEVRNVAPSAEAIPSGNGGLEPAGSAAAAKSDDWVRRNWWIVSLGIVVACAIAIGYGMYWRRGQQNLAPGTSAIQPQPDIAEGQFGPPGGEEIRILAGATRSLVDHAGKLWSADTSFTGGTAVKNSVQHVSRTLDSGFYRASRQGEFRYDIPLKSGVYELHLYFAETVYGPDATGSGGEGSRLMTVRANGATILNHFDVIGDAGGSHIADAKVFAGITPAADGKLHLEFAGENGKQALLSAIEILPGLKGHIRPMRIVARQSPYYSNDSHWWSPDNYFEGGQLAAYTQEVSGTDDPELYETERWGNFSYAIPVPPGKYALILHFAARRSAPAEPSAQQPDSPHVAHSFNVFCNGRALLSDFEPGSSAGDKNDVVIRRFGSIEPNAQGKIQLSFVPVNGYAAVSGIEVLPEGTRE